MTGLHFRGYTYSALYRKYCHKKKSKMSAQIVKNKQLEIMNLFFQVVAKGNLA